MCHKMHTDIRHNILIKLMGGMQTSINLKRILHTLNNVYIFIDVNISSHHFEPKKKSPEFSFSFLLLVHI